MRSEVLPLYCELRYSLESLWSHIKHPFRRASKRDTYLSHQCAMIRRLLRAYPWWWRGHLRLGLIENELVFNPADDKRDSRTIAELRSAGEAVLTLLDERRGSHEERSLAHYFVHAAEFYSGDYSRALLGLRELLSATKDRGQLSLSFRVQACELAGASAMVLGDNEAAASYFTDIPAKLRNARVIEAISYLRS